MTINKKEYEAFANEYKSEAQEILVLLSDANGGAGKALGDLWSASAYFLAYQDLQTGELRKGEGRLAWPISDDDLKQHGLGYPYFFKQGTIYRLRVCDLIDRTVPEGSLASFYNRFLVVDVLEENAKSDALNALLSKYRKPVVLKDKRLGKFALDKDLSLFEGYIIWLGEEISVHLDVDVDDKTSWTEALNNLVSLFEQQKKKDGEFRQFAAEKLTELANDWRDDDEAPDEITAGQFAQRISLSELSVSADGDYSAYYDDDDMFYGHSVTVSGNLKSGIDDANIEG